MSAITTATWTADASETSVPLARSEERSLWELHTCELLDRVAFNELAPGDGSVSIMVACIGTALLRKAFLVSLKKERERRIQRHLLEMTLAQVEVYAASLQMATDQNVNAFATADHDRGLSCYDRLEGELLQNSSEERLLGRTSLLLSLSEKIHRLYSFVLEQLPSIDDVILADAITGIRLLNSATEGLLLSATSSLCLISDRVVHSAMNRQIKEMKYRSTQLEQRLSSCLQGRYLARP